MAMSTSGDGPDRLDELADLVERGQHQLAWDASKEVRRLGRLTPPERVAELLRARAAELRGHDYSGRPGERRARKASRS